MIEKPESEFDNNNTQRTSLDPPPPSYNQSEQERQQQREHASTSSALITTGNASGPSSSVSNSTFTSTSPSTSSGSNVYAQTFANNVRQATHSNGQKLHPSLIEINPDWSPQQTDFYLQQIPYGMFKDRLKERLKKNSGNNPFESEVPRGFGRQPKPKATTPPIENDCNNIINSPTYSNFEPFYCPSRQKLTAAQGFYPIYPGRIMVDHDVSVLDMERFLFDVITCSKLSGTETFLAGVVPFSLFFMDAGILYKVRKSMEKGMYKRNLPHVSTLIETYQQEFFQPRKLDVFLVDGVTRLTGRYPGDPSYINEQPCELGSPRKDDYDQSSTSDSSIDDMLGGRRRHRHKNRSRRHKAHGEPLRISQSQGPLSGIAQAVIARKSAASFSPSKAIDPSLKTRFRLVFKPQL